MLCVLYIISKTNEISFTTHLLVIAYYELMYCVTLWFQLLAYADDVNILGGNAHTVKENAETLVGAT